MEYIYKSRVHLQQGFWPQSWKFTWVRSVWKNDMRQWMYAFFFSLNIPEQSSPQIGLSYFQPLLANILRANILFQSDEKMFNSNVNYQIIFGCQCI